MPPGMIWYFDFISPYAYLQFKRLQALGVIGEFQMTPILFAGILKSLGQRGPAEIPGKREFTYRQVCWLARRQQVPFMLPAAHPFNPLKLLRLALHLEVSMPAVSRLFDFVWRDGCIPDDAPALRSVAMELEVTDLAVLDDPGVKTRLAANTDRAIAAGVFGVPTIAIGDHLFWGQDSTDMALQFNRDPGSFAADDAIISRLPAAASRRT